MVEKKRTKAASAGALQISLFNSRETPDAFRKAVQVVHSRPKSPLSLLQRKLGNAWLKHAVETPADDNGWWELGIRNLAESIGFDSKNRQYLKESAEALMRIVHEWDVLAPVDKRVQWKASVLFPEVEIRSDVIRYQISSQMRERLVNPDMYAMIDMHIVRRFRRAPSLGIWEFCIRFEKLGHTAEVEWSKFRDMVLGESAEAKTYREYKFFKSKVLNPAIAEINSESNHTVTLLESKVGRSVSGIRFDIRRKVAIDGVEDDLSLELVGELVKFGLPPSEARSIAKAHDAASIRRALDYTRRRMADRKLAPLTNPGAYFRQALAGRYAMPEGEAAPSPPAARKAAAKSVDIRGMLMLQRTQEAESYFGDLDAGEQGTFVDRYNAQQESASLRIKKRANRVAQTAFFQWLAIDTWGEPTSDELLAHAQKLLQGRDVT